MTAPFTLKIMVALLLSQAPAARLGPDDIGYIDQLVEEGKYAKARDIVCSQAAKFDDSEFPSVSEQEELGIKLFHAQLFIYCARYNGLAGSPEQEFHSRQRAIQLINGALEHLPALGSPESYPHTLYFQVLLANLYLQNEDFDSARDLLWHVAIPVGSASGLGGYPVVAYYELVDSLAKLREQAIDTIELSPTASGKIAGLARISDVTQQNESIFVQKLQRALSTFETSEHSFLVDDVLYLMAARTIADYKAKTGKIEDAEDFIRRAIKGIENRCGRGCPDLVSLHSHLATLRLQLKDPSGAQAHLDAAASVATLNKGKCYPQFFELYYTRYNALHTTAQRKSAASELSLALASRACYESAVAPFININGPLLRFPRLARLSDRTVASLISERQGDHEFVFSIIDRKNHSPDSYYRHFASATRTSSFDKVSRLRDLADRLAQHQFEVSRENGIRVYFDSIERESIRRTYRHLSTQLILDTLQSRPEQVVPNEHAEPSLAKIRAALPSKGALLEYVRYWPCDADTEKCAERYALFAISKRRFDVFDLGPAIVIDNAAIRFVDDVVGNTTAYESGRALYDLLMPSGRSVTWSKHLLISAGSFLSGVPFAALRRKDGSFIIERQSIGLVSIPSDILEPVKGSSVARQRPVLFTNPFGDLGSSTKRIEKLYDKQVTIFSGRGASAGALAKVGSPILLHIDSHGGTRAPSTNWLATLLMREANLVANSLFGGQEDPFGSIAPLRDPLDLSFVEMWSEGGSSRERITARQLQFLDLRGTELVVLASCKSGTPLVKSGDDSFLGLRQVFHAAGARTVLASLWEIEDYATSKMLDHYYQSLSEGADRTEALQRAQMQLIDIVELENPYHWAGFVSSGLWHDMPSMIRRSNIGPQKVEAPAGCRCTAGEQHIGEPILLLMSTIYLFGCYFAGRRRV